jgi:hypothetical protein
VTVRVVATHVEQDQEYEATLAPGEYLLITHGHVVIDPAALPRKYRRVELVPVRTPS